MTAFEKAKRFIYRNARPIELARWRYHFENGDKGDVLAALSSFQNEDGGFGSALDPNLTAPTSSPYQTYRAVRILEEISFYDREHPVVKGILSYLESKTHFSGRVWMMTLPENNEYPCAHWFFHRSQDPRNSDFDPSAALAGFIIRCADPSTPLYRLGRSVARSAYESALSRKILTEPSLILSYVYLLKFVTKADALDIFDTRVLASILKESIRSAVTPDVLEWDREGAVLPSFFIGSPSSIFYPEISTLADYECAYNVAVQRASGFFDAQKVWMSYPEEWAISRHISQSDETVRRILYLKKFGKI